MQLSLARSIAILPLFVLLTAVGCNRVDPKDRFAEMNSTNMQRAVSLYGAYQMRHNFWGPKDDSAFRRFVEGVRPEKLERIGVNPSALDEVFISSRDGEPFKVRYGVKGSAMGSDEPVIFEATGKDGKRMVGFLNSTQREVDETEYKQLWRNGAGAPVSSRNS